MCPNGTVNWKQIYGEETFIIRRPIFESELRERRKVKEVNIKDLEQRAKRYAKVGEAMVSNTSLHVCIDVGVIQLLLAYMQAQAEAQGLTYDEILQKAQASMNAPVVAAANGVTGVSLLGPLPAVACEQLSQRHRQQLCWVWYELRNRSWCICSTAA